MYEAIDRYVYGLIERSSPEYTAWNRRQKYTMEKRQFLQ